MKQISKGTPEQLLRLVEDRIEELSGGLDSATNTCGMDINPDVSDDEVESSFIYPEDLEALEDGDYESHVTEPIESSVSWDDAEAYDDDVSAILDFLANKGYDADSEIVKDYAHTVAKQLDAYRKSWHEAGEAFSYGLSDWYQDTKKNYPDELEELPRIDACDAIQSSRWDDWSPEDFEGGYTEWDEVASKSVKDSDGFWTDYTMWYNEFKDEYVFTFGDKDIYYPENADIDWECENEDEAWEWFDNYNGFEDDDEIEECSDVKASIRRDNPVEWVDATFVVRKMYNKFPDFDFIDERDLGENVALYFKLGSDIPSVEAFLSRLGIEYRISNGKLRIVVPEDQDYEEPGEYEEWRDSPVDECQSITSSSEVDLKPFVVRFGWDSGGPENGPSYGYGEDIVYAISKEDACSRWEAENQEQIEGFNSGKYGGYEGCFARPATDNDIQEYEDNQKYWEEMEKHYRFDDEDVYPIDECDSIKSSEEFYDMGTGLEYWYFTTHGVQPGSVPKGLDILEVIDRPEGSYFSTNRVLTTDALKYYDIKEKSPY